MRIAVNGSRRANKLKAATETLMLLSVDALSLLAIFRLATFLRAEVLPVFYAGFPQELPFAGAREVFWIFPVWFFFFYYEGFYSKRFSFWDEIRAHWKAAVFATVGVFTVVSLGKLSPDISRTVVVLMGASALVLFPAFRLGGKSLLRRAGFLKRRVLILGAGETGRLIARAIDKEPNYGYTIVGYLDDDPARAGTVINGVKVHRGVDSADRYIDKCGITDVVIAMPEASNGRLQDIIGNLQHKAERVLYVPDMVGMAVMSTEILHFFQEQAFALEIKNNLDDRMNVLAKRAFDYVVASLLSILLLVPIAIIIILIRISSKGAAIYRQERVGKGGSTFMCYKFRTMYSDAQERLGSIIRNDPEARDQWIRHRKLNNDPRVTPIGRYLRSTSLDELPQLWNVLRGEMSLVGPRPVTREEIQMYYREASTLCFRVQPGITGLWQVSGRSNTGYDYRIALDSWYVRNWNLWLDITILLRTVMVVLKREGAR